MKDYSTMTHEELVQAVYEAAKQLTPEEQAQIRASIEHNRLEAGA